MGLGIAIAVNGSTDSQLAEADWVEVEERIGGTTTYRLHYPVDIQEGDLPRLTDSRFDPSSQLSILVPVGERSHCLVKGPVHGQRIRLVHGGDGSTLEVNGSDTTVTLDRETRSEVWSGVTDSDVATSILDDHGYSTDVASTPARHPQSKHSLVQRDTDLAFLRRLARRNGFLFWISCDDQGNETAHFKRPPLDGSPAGELVINLERPSLDSLDIDWDVERPTRTQSRQLDLNSKETLDGGVEASPLEALGRRDLAAIVDQPRSLRLSAPADSSGDLQARGEGALIEAGWFIHARCQTSLEALGALVRAHTVVNLRGAGSRHSGRYFVSRVRHRIDETAHRMDIELIRNAWEVE